MLRAPDEVPAAAPAAAPAPAPAAPAAAPPAAPAVDPMHSLLAARVDAAASEIRRLHAVSAATAAGITDPDLVALVTPALLKDIELDPATLRPKATTYLDRARALAAKMAPAPAAAPPAAPAAAPAKPVVTLAPPTETQKALPTDLKKRALAILQST
jgi:pyruvate dehydrogenase E2 component (dihydrolipoamide acetyltransferase)